MTSKVKKIEQAATAKKASVGEESLKLAKNTEKYNAIELQQEIHKGSKSEKSYEEEVWETVDKGRKAPELDPSKDFFIVVLFKKERLLQNVVRQYFFYRQSCPTPEYDQTVYKYHRKGDELEYIWTVANNVTTLYLKKMLDENAIPKDQETLAFMAEAFLTGNMDKYAKKLNKEI